MECSSTIDAVKVYRRGATVTRTADWPGGEDDIVEFTGLPLCLVDATVRVQVEEAVGDLVAADVRIGLHAVPREAVDESEAETQLREVRRSLQRARREASLLKAESRLLAEIEVPERPDGEEGKPPPASPMAARVALESFTDQAVRERQERVRELRDEIAKLEEQEADLQDRVNRASSADLARASEVTKVAVVRLRGSAKSARLRLEYFVPGARWAPQYQCAIARDGSEATLRQRALVAQDTGEDWRSVELTLSTADPQQWTELPELQSIRIGKEQPTPAKRAWREPPKGSAELFADFDRDRKRYRSLLPPSPRFSPPAASVDPLPDLDLEPPEPRLAAGLAEEEIDDLEGFADEAGEMPAPAPPVAAKAAARSSGMAFGAAPGGGGADKGNLRRRMKSKSRKKRSMPREKEELVASSDDDMPAAESGLPRYQWLELKPPTASGRNQLHPLDSRDTYQKTLKRSGLRVPFDVMDPVRAASKRARAVERLGLPSGARDVRDASGRYDYAYQATSRLDVASDGSWNSVPVDSRSVPCDLSYVVVPREDSGVYRIAALENPTRAPLLPGPVEVYMGGEFVVSSKLPTVAPGGHFRLGLGVEQAIKCARNTGFREKRSGEAVVAMTELWHDIDIELVNNLRRPVSIEVRERIPQPAKDAEVVVEEGSVDPPWVPWDQREKGRVVHGGRSWSVEVDATSARTLKASYVVKIYANNEIQGGNRREA